MDDEVVIRTFDYPHQGELARLHLDHHEIDSRIDDALVVGMNPLWGPAMGGIKLQVRQVDAARAEPLLRELEQSPDWDAEEDDDPNSEPPRARRDSTTDEMDRRAKRAALAAWLGWFLLPGIGQLYSIFLLAGITPRRLSPAGRREYRIACVVDAVAVALVLFIAVSNC